MDINNLENYLLIFSKVEKWAYPAILLLDTFVKKSRIYIIYKYMYMYTCTRISIVYDSKNTEAI